MNHIVLRDYSQSNSLQGIGGKATRAQALSGDSGKRSSCFPHPMYTAICTIDGGCESDLIEKGRAGIETARIVVTVILPTAKVMS